MAKAARIQIIRQIEKARRSRVIAYVTSTRPNLEVQMAMDSVRYIYDHLQGIEAKREKDTRMGGAQRYPSIFAHTLGIATLHPTYELDGYASKFGCARQTKGLIMQITEIPINAIDVSEFNVRKNLADGQFDSSIEDLANSVAKQGLLSPITVFQKPGGRFGLVAGQRRLMACQHLKLKTISAIVRANMSNAEATAVSLVENVHRADMNPSDKARAFKALLDKFGDLQSVSRETGVGVPTIRKYIQLLDLAPELIDRLSAGDIKQTDALARLAQRFQDPGSQIEAWDKISGFNQSVQTEIIKQLDSNLGNLDDLVSDAQEGAFDSKIVRNCPWDCPTIPSELKQEVANLIRSHKFKDDVRKTLKRK